MQFELKRADVEKVGSLLSEIEETPSLVVKESNGTPSKIETLKSLLRDALIGFGGRVMASMTRPHQKLRNLNAVVIAGVQVD